MVHVVVRICICIWRDRNGCIWATFGGWMTLTIPSTVDAVPNTNAAGVSARNSTDRIFNVMGWLSAVGIAVTVWLGLWVTPPDRFMGNLVRLLYIHPPMAWVAFVAYGVAFLASLCYLW